MNDRQKFFLEDLTFNAEYEILETSKKNKELEELAIKKGIPYPSKDISLFKCKYAMANEENRNGCTLPRKEVKKAIGSLNFKPIDKDHLRKSTVGAWIGAELDDNDIIAYGAFWKSNFPEDYEEIKKRMLDGTMKISFEAWGDRKMTGDKSYELHDIEFAGGALLFDTVPAFPEAEVLEFSSKKGQVLEFAKVMENSKTEEEKLMEEARLNFYYDSEFVGRIMMETECGTCKNKGWNDVLSIDFENSKVKGKCYGCGEVAMFDLTPSSVVIKKGKRPEMSKTESKEKANITDSSAKEQKSKEEGGIVVDEFLKKYNKASVEEMSKYIDETLVSLSAKEKELAAVTADKEALTKQLEESKLAIENAKLEVEKMKTEYATVKTELDKRVTAEKAAFVKARKDELGEEFAKDLTDEDITNDLKFENAKLKKELSIAKAAQEKGSTTTGLESGNKKEVPAKAFEIQKNIQTQAFGSEKK